MFDPPEHGGVSGGGGNCSGSVVVGAGGGSSAKLGLASPLDPLEPAAEQAVGPYLKLAVEPPSPPGVIIAPPNCSIKACALLPASTAWLCAMKRPRSSPDARRDVAGSASLSRRTAADAKSLAAVPKSSEASLARPRARRVRAGSNKLIGLSGGGVSGTVGGAVVEVIVVVEVVFVRVLLSSVASKGRRV